MFRFLKFLFLSNPIIQSMKGLGGAELGITCFPDRVQLLTPFFIHIAYELDIYRPVDIHIDVLNADSHEWYSGNKTESDYIAGNLTMSVVLPSNAKEPFLWKVFITPRGEPFPNMLAETGMSISIGNPGADQCNPNLYQFSNTTVPKKNDYIILDSSLNHALSPGSNISIPVRYFLTSAEEAVVNFNIMNKENNLPVSGGAPFFITKGTGFLLGNVYVPLVLPDRVYISVSMIPSGGNWNTRYAQDRTYRLSVLSGKRNLRT